MTTPTEEPRWTTEPYDPADPANYPDHPEHPESTDEDNQAADDGT